LFQIKQEVKEIKRRPKGDCQKWSVREESEEVLIKLELGTQERFGLRDREEGTGTLLFKERGRRRGETVEE